MDKKKPESWREFFLSEEKADPDFLKDRGVTMNEKIYQALKSYRCQYTKDENEDGSDLVDVVTPPGDTDIQRGLMELETK